MSPRRSELQQTPLSPEQRLDAMEDCVRLLTQQMVELNRAYQAMPDEMTRAVTAAGETLLADKELISGAVARVVADRALVTDILETIEALHQDREDRESGVRVRELTSKVKYRAWVLWVGLSAMLVSGYVPEPIKKLLAWLTGK